MEEKSSFPKSILKSVKITRVLGHGSFGMVLKAESHTPPATTAIKLIFPPNDSTTWNGWKVEMELFPILKKRHQNVVRIIRISEHQYNRRDLKRLFKDIPLDDIAEERLAAALFQADLAGSINLCLIQMELCGHTLRHWLLSEDCVSAETSMDVKIVKDIINGITYLHNNNIVHRDLKPENILFLDERYSFPLKIGDFGLSKQVIELSSKQTTSSHIGTALYAAPEINYRMYGAQTDLYSLGLVMFEVLQKIHFKDRNYMFDRLVNYRDISVVQSHPEIVNAIDIIVRLTQRDPKLRMQNVKEISIQLSSDLNEEDDKKYTKMPSAIPSLWDGGSRRITFGFTRPIEHFVGRYDELDILKAYVFKSSPGTAAIISGIGGQGKTQLCRQFINQLSNSNVNPAVITWFDGSSKRTLQNHLDTFDAYWIGDPAIEEIPARTISEQLNINNTIAKVRSDIGNGKWVAVFDNVYDDDDVSSAVVELLKADVFVIITTRHSAFFPGEGLQIILNSLSNKEAATFVNMGIPVIYQNEVTELCDRLDNHVLAIDQAVSYIRMRRTTSLIRNSYGIKECLQDLEHNSITILDYSPKLSSYDSTVYKVVLNSLDLIESQYQGSECTATILLIILSFLDLIKIADFCQLIYNCDKPSGIINYEDDDDNMNGVIETGLIGLRRFYLIDIDHGVISTSNLVKMIMQHNSNTRHVLVGLLKGIRIETLSESLVPYAKSIWQSASRHPQVIKEHCNFAHRLVKRMNMLGMDSAIFLQEAQLAVGRAPNPSGAQKAVWQRSIVVVGNAKMGSSTITRNNDKEGKLRRAKSDMIDANKLQSHKHHARNTCTIQ